MSIRWDALLARHTARELSSELEGARLTAVRFDRTGRDMLLLFRERSLLWRLHPRRGYLVWGRAADPSSTDYRIRGSVRRVHAPDDERIVRFEIPTRAGPVEIVVELLGNQWNAMISEGTPPVIRHVLWLRERRPERTVGSVYRPPKSLTRAGVDGELSEAAWVEVLEAASPDERPRVLVARVAWTSPLNAAALAAAHGAGGGGYELWKQMVRAEAASPVVLDGDSRCQPYPFPLPGTRCRSASSLLSAFGECAESDEAEDAPAEATGVGPAVMDRLLRRTRRAARRAAGLRRELEGLDDPARLRAIGDLILARYGEIPSGTAQARLTGFDGEAVAVELDPSLPPHANAERYYRDAGKTERAHSTLPALVEAAEREQAALEELLSRARAGDVDEEAVTEALGSVRAPTRKGRPEPALPYRTFTSSGGIEIRVGKGAKWNDELTFRHSSPGDVWMHARHAAGAHVILRWTGPGRPPARDLEEAAVLAALHSKARTSGSVPVDWTLRKYVRKPRGAAPGAVLPDRVETLFVDPDPGLVAALAARSGVD